MRYLFPLLIAAAPAMGDDLDDRALAVFSAAYADACMGAFLEDGSLVDPAERFDVKAPSSFGEPEPMVLWQFRCNIGAYNVQSVLIAHSEYNGVHPLPLPRPEVDVVLENPDDYESAVKAVNLVGWSATPFIVNGLFDPATLTLTATGHWRGLGDASDTAVWRLLDEGFHLIRFEVDASYDGQVNPQLLVSFE